MRQFCYSTELLLPPSDQAALFSVVACDQYTAEPAYWEQVAAQTAGSVSAFQMTYPEVYLNEGDPQTRIDAINRAMQQALDGGFFQSYPQAMLLVRRILRSGAVRLGLVCCIDLEEYDFHAGSHSLIRATEGTVLSRIPPRVHIRTDAPMELPHIMLLADDPAHTVIEPLAESFRDPVYDFDLMQDSGHLTGRLLTPAEQQQVHRALDALYQQAAEQSADPLLFAVGDGNHSLATAKTCYENVKQQLTPEEAAAHPARYALVELVNLHDASLEFEPIHRAVFEIDPADLLAQFCACCGAVPEKIEGVQQLCVVQDDTHTVYSIQNPQSKLTVGSLQQFLDQYLAAHSGEVDYIHGQDVVESLCRDNLTTLGFLLPAMQKEELFPSVLADGALPRKTFSMGEACDKRFYLEARKITY